MCLNAVLPNLVHTTRNYLGLVTKIDLCLINNGCSIKSQQEINKLLAGPVVNQPRRYGYILKTLILTALYAPAMPIVVPLGCCGLFIAFFL